MAETSPAGGWRQRLLIHLLNLYPPYLGAGVRVRRLRHSPTTAADGAGDPRSAASIEPVEAIEARMRLRLWNRNVLGTHFGGSLYSMCDPFFVLILRQHLGAGYVIWDKAASIRFRRPGRGVVAAVFHIPCAVAMDIRQRADRGETVEPQFTVEVKNAAGQVVAVVDKILHVRRAETSRGPGA